MSKKLFLLLALGLCGRDGARGQQQQPVASVQPDCMVFFNLSAASSGAQAAVNSTGTSVVIDNHQAGCFGWTVAYTSHGFSAENLVFQSAPDNAAGSAPGTWGTVAVCGTAECLGINPNTATTSAITTTKDISPWYRMNLTSKTGTGGAVGVLYGWKVDIVANGGAPVVPPVVFPASVFLATDGASTPIASNAATAPTEVPIGQSATSTGTDSVAIGRLANASATRAVAVGRSAAATANFATALGPAASAQLLGAVAVGLNASAAGSTSVAVGDGSQATQVGDVAVGFNANATGSQGVAVGDRSQATALDAIAIGFTATSFAAHAVAIGDGISNSVAASVLIGANAIPMLNLRATGGQFPTIAFAGMAAFVALGNGFEVNCSDCTVTSGVDNTCAGGGTGAHVFALNGVGKCVI